MASINLNKYERAGCHSSGWGQYLLKIRIKVKSCYNGLLVAKNEISLLFSAVQRIHDAHKTREAKKFFKENPHFFKILIFDDIKDVDFSSDPNVIRNTRRKIFHKIVKNAGKKIAGNKIAKELALE